VKTSKKNARNHNQALTQWITRAKFNQHPSNKAKFFRWVVDTANALLNLEIKIPDLGLNQLEKTLALARRMSTKTHAKPYWLDWTVKGLFACHKENHCETFVNVVLERHMKTWSPNAFLTYIKQMLTRPIDAMIANTEYKLAHYLHTHVYDHKRDANVAMCANPASETFEFYAPKVPKTTNSEMIDSSSCIYCQSIPVNVTQDSTFFITDLYFCDQIVFNERSLSI